MKLHPPGAAARPPPVRLYRPDPAEDLKDSVHDRLKLLLEADPETGCWVYVGPWLLFGQQLPGVSGVLTFTVGNEAISVNVRGRLGDSNGRLTLVLDPLTVNGEQITLTHVDEHRLAGVGTSRLTWEPQGPVELARQAADGPSGVRP